MGNFLRKKDIQKGWKRIPTIPYKVLQTPGTSFYVQGSTKVTFS